MLRLMARFACPRRALHWGNVAPGRNHPLTHSWRPPQRISITAVRPGARTILTMTATLGPAPSSTAATVSVRRLP
jgi:hypothetical protein